jgi:hypothetical protein
MANQFLIFLTYFDGVAAERIMHPTPSWRDYRVRGRLFDNLKGCRIILPDAQTSSRLGGCA